MEAAIAVALVNGTNNLVCLLQDSVLMMVCETVDIVSYSIPVPQKYCCDDSVVCSYYYNYSNMVRFVMAIYTSVVVDNLRSLV